MQQAVVPDEEVSVAPLSTARLADQAYEQLREMIVSGRFAMGTRLIEVQLAKNFGISRAPVREAMRRLVEDGLVDERPRVGYTVAEFDAAAVIDLYNVRLSLEATSIRLATRRGMATAPLRDLIDRMAAAARAGEQARVSRYELDFHAEICRASGNALIAHLFHTLEGRLLMAIALDNEGQADLQAIATEHTPLIAAIESGDEQAAAATMTGHILSTVKPLILRLGGDPGQLLVPLDHSEPA
ncbi:GntR family transcriptional regulator [Zavarzinia aquatilis]|uniref:GntR family transcriptional regulator n=1 Tax=Zavarzinia aquatilis TaxID=2211142 RepID=A0A317EE74_9PROT|nr:GntR family transcriptional regulator [Zavarzinia aquatilis]PWR25219.1 GntR family transcriptional regulator [Zavarzinia aquatilis]